MRVKDVMSIDPHIITPDLSLKKAAEIMRDCDCGYLPVGVNDRLTGAITDRDIVIRALADGFDAETTRAGDIMTPKIQYCFAEDDLRIAAERMKEQQIRRLVVLNSDKRLVGILSVGDIAAQDTRLVGSIESEVCRRAA